MYKSFILPHISLHIEIWGSSPNVYMSKLETRQNQLLRSILGVKLINGIPNMHTADMYSRLNVLKVKNIFKMCLFRFLISVLKGFLPTFYNDMLAPLVPQHNYETRRLNFRHPPLSCEIERRGIVYQMILLNEGINFEVYANLSVKSAVSQYRLSLLCDQ